MTRQRLHLILAMILLGLALLALGVAILRHAQKDDLSPQGGYGGPVGHMQSAVQ